MVDYDKSTGSSGTMRIRDTGTYVEFWISANNSTTFAHQLPWKYTINGSTSAWKEYDYKAGSGFEMLGRWNITTSQTVTFYLGDTGTGGLGGPTTFSKFISRVAPPSPPSTPKLSNVTTTSVHVTFTDGVNNGAAIDSRQIGYGTNSSSPQTIIASTGSTTINGLTAGTTYYFWARTHNSQGYSAWSGRASTVTTRPPDAPSSFIVSSVTQTSVTGSFRGNGDGGSPITIYQVGYGTSPAEPEVLLTTPDAGTVTISGLSPGLKYYIWTRAQNIGGFGPWSEPTPVTLIAGAWVKVGDYWRRAVPYVNVGGTWKVARSWVKVGGFWRETL